MSFLCSFITLQKNTCKLISNFYSLRSISTNSVIRVKDKYILKKLTRNTLKTMQPIGDPNLLSPPEQIRGIKVLDKSLFTKTIQVLAIFLEKCITISKVMPYLKKYILKLPKLKPVVNEIQPDQSGNITELKYVLLNPIYVKSWTDLNKDDVTALEALGIKSENAKLIDFQMKYENWNADEIIKCILPEDLESVQSFSKVDHIVHLNLREHVLDYKHIIGNILLDKVVGCQTVVNKLNKIDNTYRNFQMEILCGNNNTKVTVKENRCKFSFDFATVYWNPRLSTEHERIVNMLNPGDILYDVFAGVGPFSIPAAKKKCKVLANDLNPESYKWLNHNVKINKVNSSCIKTFNKDGRDFILNDIKKDLKNRWLDDDYNNIFITMNLPASAPEFLPCFKHLFSLTEFVNVEIKKLPMVYVYCFAKGENPIEIARELVEKCLGRELPHNTEIFHVRTVSNFKDMMRIGFELPRDYLFDNLHKKRGPEDDLASNNKKYKYGEEQEQTENEKHIQGSRSEEFEVKI